MTSQTSLDHIAERVERLLVRHEELQRTNALLAEQVAALTQERDSLRSRLNAARARVDALIERLPSNQGAMATAQAEMQSLHDEAASQHNAPSQPPEPSPEELAERARQQALAEQLVLRLDQALEGDARLI